jgi:allantoin racemase
MKALIINPNSDPEMTKAIEISARAFAGDAFRVDCLPTLGAPRFIDTYEDQAKAAPGMIDSLRKYHDSYDAFVVACHCDPNLDLMKEISLKPVVGIGEASMKLASMLGHRFSVISTAEHSIPNKEALIDKYHLRDSLASVRAPDARWKDKPAEEKFYRTAVAAVESDGAEVIVLGCAGLAGLEKRLEKKLGVPVLDPIICALIIASGLVRAGLTTSKARRYNPQG